MLSKGAIGSGTGILLAVVTIYDGYAAFARENTKQDDKQIMVTN
jgi:hypothetical protein